MRKAWIFALALFVILGLAACVSQPPAPTSPPAMVKPLSVDWYVYNPAAGQEAPKALTFTQDGKVTVDGTEMTWAWQNSGENYLDGVIRDGEENRFCFFLQQSGNNQSLCLTAWVTDGDGGVLGEYSDHQSFAILNSSRWSRLDGEEGTPTDFGIALDRAELNLDGRNQTYGWKFVDQKDKENAVLSLGDGAFTLTLGKRDGYPVIALKQEKTGALALYHAGSYDPGWPEAVYPQALTFLKSYLAGGSFTVGDVTYQDQTAAVYLHDLFAGLEYRDSAEIAGRFVSLPAMYTGIVQKTTDKGGNIRENYICRNTYDISGALVATNGSDAMERFGVYTEPYDIQQITYGPDGKMEAVTVGDAQSATPTYDEAGHLVSLSVRRDSGDYTSKFTYDKNGRVTKLSVWDGKIVFTYTYDKEGHLTQKVKRLKEGYTTVTRYTYQDGVLAEVNETYQGLNKGPTKTRYVYTSDDQGRLLSAVVTSNKQDFASQELIYEYKDLWFFNADGFTMFGGE